MKIKLALTAILSLIVGVFMGRQTIPPAPSKVVIEPPNIQNLQRIVDVDLQDYYRLKSEEERYRKADEILGKIIMVFLADLGMKISKPFGVNQKQVATAAANLTSPPTPAAVASKTIVTTPVPISRPPLTDVRTPDDIAEFLKASQMENFEDAVKTSSAFSNKNGQLQNFSGEFIGAAQILSKGESERWEIEMRLSAKMSAGKLTGQRSLKLSKNGRVFSDSSGNGGLDEEYREVSHDPEVVIIAAGPNTYSRPSRAPALRTRYSITIYKMSCKRRMKMQPGT